MVDLSKFDDMDWIVMSESWMSISPARFEEANNWAEIKDEFFSVLEKTLIEQLEKTDEEDNWRRRELIDSGITLRKAILDWYGQKNAWNQIGKVYNSDGTEDYTEMTTRKAHPSEVAIGIQLQCIFTQYNDWKDRHHVESV